MRCPFHGFQSVQFFNRGEHRFDLPDRPLKNEQECAAVAEKQRIGRVFYDLSEAAPTVEQLLTHCSVTEVSSVPLSLIAGQIQNGWAHGHWHGLRSVQEPGGRGR
jgi:hypothetical protein